MKKRLLILAAVLGVLCLLPGCKVSGNPLPQGMEEETVLERGREIVTMLNEKNWQGVYDSLRADAQEGFSPEQIEAAVMEHFDRAGAYQEEKEAMATGQEIKDTGEEYGTAVFYCKHEKKNVMYRVAFSDDMELIGFSVAVQ